MSDKIYYVKLCYLLSVSKSRYDILQTSHDVYELFEDGIKVAVFTRETFRQSLNALGRSSNWIGSMLRLFNKKYPVPPRLSFRTDFERLVDRVKESGLVDYLRSKGFRVSHTLCVPDKDIITFLEGKGYVIEGLLNGSYYSTEDNSKPSETPILTKTSY